MIVSGRKSGQGDDDGPPGDEKNQGRLGEVTIEIHRVEQQVGGRSGGADKFTGRRARTAVQGDFLTRTISEVVVSLTCPRG